MHTTTRTHKHTHTLTHTHIDKHTPTYTQNKTITYSGGVKREESKKASVCMYVGVCGCVGEGVCVHRNLSIESKKKGRERGRPVDTYRHRET